MFFSREGKAPEEVFTPRTSAINDAMYIAREELQQSLERALKSNFHIILFGQSGSGKTWLYKGVLAAGGTPFVIANLANAARFGSIADEFENLIGRLSDKTSVTRSSEWEINVADIIKKKWGKKVSSAKIKDPFEALLQVISTAAGGRPSVLVLDNMEAIVGKQAIMDELGGLVTLLDDESYAQYRVKFLIVGVPGDVREYFQKVSNLKTISNRLRELPEVARMSRAECDRLVKAGFIKQLKYKVFDLEKLQAHVAWVTDQLPQIIHEYCLELAEVGAATRKITSEMLSQADKKFLQMHLAASYAIIEPLMNRAGTRIGRRNQILYSIGAVDKEEFDKTDIEAVIRTEFVKSTEDRTLNVAGILTELANTEGLPPILRKDISGRYRFADARHRMCLRVMLRKSDNDQVELLNPNTLL